MGKRKEIQEQATFNFFVYGTLREGQPLADWLHGTVIERHTRWARGVMYPTYSYAYPVVYFDRAGTIIGELCVCDPTDSLVRLIEMERRAGYALVEVPMLDQNLQETGEKAFAFHYQYRNPTSHPITHGDWVRYVNESNIEYVDSGDNTLATTYQQAVDAVVCPNCGSPNTHTCIKEGKKFEFIVND